MLQNNLLFAIRFVDRDMYMRYAGNGVGHYKVDLAEDPKTAESFHEPDIAEEAVPIHEAVVPTEGADLGDSERDKGGATLGEVDDANDGREAKQDDEELDDEELDDEEDDDEGDDKDDEDDDLGAEDGEGGFVDPEDDEGYAPL